jgi:hypothetical protein
VTQNYISGRDACGIRDGGVFTKAGGLRYVIAVPSLMRMQVTEDERRVRVLSGRKAAGLRWHGRAPAGIDGEIAFARAIREVRKIITSLTAEQRERLAAVVAADGKGSE